MQHHYHPSLQASKLFRSQLLNIRFFEVEEEEKRNFNPKKRRKGSGSLQGWRAKLSCAPWRNNLTPVITAQSCILCPCASRLREAGSTSPGPHPVGPSARSRPVSPFYVKPSKFGLAERHPAPVANRTLPLVIT